MDSRPPRCPAQSGTLRITPSNAKLAESIISPEILDLFEEFSIIFLRVKPRVLVKFLWSVESLRDVLLHLLSRT